MELSHFRRPAKAKFFIFLATSLILLTEALNHSYAQSKVREVMEGQWLGGVVASDGYHFEFGAPGHWIPANGKSAGHGELHNYLSPSPILADVSSRANRLELASGNKGYRATKTFSEPEGLGYIYKIKGPDTDYQHTVKNTFRPFKGCGKCPVGSSVTIIIDQEVTAQGLLEGQDAPRITNVTNTFKFTRTQ